MDKNMRSGIWAAAAALCLCGPAVWAQGPRAGKAQKGRGVPAGQAGARQMMDGPEELSNEDIVKQLVQHVDLRADQQKKVKKILDDAKPEIQKLEKEMAALSGRMKKAMFRVRESIRDTLDLDQKQRFDDGADNVFNMRAGPPMMCPGRPGMGHPHGGGPMMGPPMGPPEMMGQTPMDGPGGPMLREGEGPGPMDGPPPQEPQDR